MLLDLVAELHKSLLVRLQLLGAGQARLGAGQERPLEAQHGPGRSGQLRRRVGRHHVVDVVDPSHEVLFVGRLKLIKVICI